MPASVVEDLYKPATIPTAQTLPDEIKSLESNFDLKKALYFLAKLPFINVTQAFAITEIVRKNGAADSAFYEQLVYLFANRGDRDGTRNAIQLMQQDGVRLSVAQTTPLLKSCVFHKDYDNAETLFRPFATAHDALPLYKILLKSYYNMQQKFEFCVRDFLATRMALDGDATFAFWLIRALANSFNSRLGIEFYTEMVRRSTLQLPADVYAYVSRMADAQNDAAFAKQVLADMKERQLTLSDTALHNFMRVLQRQEPALAKSLVDDAMHDVPARALYVRTYNAYLDLCARAKTPQAAEDALFAWKHMTDAYVDPDIRTFSLLLRVCGSAGNEEACRKVLALMKQLKQPATFEDFPPSMFANVSTEIGEELIGYLKQFGVSATTFVYNAILRNSSGATADRWFARMKAENVPRDVVTYNTLIEIFAKANNMDRCNHLIDEMKAASINPDIWTYNNLIFGLSLRTADDALKWLASVRADGLVKPDVVTYNHLFTQLLRKDPVPNCAALWEDMRAHGVQPQLLTYNFFIKAQGASGNAAQCVELLRQADKEGPAPDVITYTTCYDYVSDINTLQTLWQEMTAKGIKPQLPAFAALIQQCAKNNEKNWAVELVQQGIQAGLLEDGLLAQLEASDGLSAVASKLSKIKEIK